VFRQPEPGLGYLLGLTRGQALSLAMVVGGGVLLHFSRKRKLRIDSLSTDAPGFTPQVQPAASTTPPAAETPKTS
jgi:prolipoprotein diacylglyceryltransferase